VRAYWDRITTVWQTDVAEGRRPPITWSDCAKHFTDYVGEDTRALRRKALDMFHSSALAQGAHESVADYNRRFLAVGAQLNPADVTEVSKISSYLHNMRHNLRRKAEFTHYGAERTSLTKIMDAARSEEERQRRDKEEADRAKPSQMQEDAKISCAIAHTARDVAKPDEGSHRKPHYQGYKNARGPGVHGSHKHGSQGGYQSHKGSHHHAKRDDGPRPTLPAHLQQHVAHINLAGMPYEAKVKAAADCLKDLMQRGVLREHNLSFSCGGDHRKSECNKRSAFLAHFTVKYNDLQRHTNLTA
jgi:hypothetical protein